MESYRDHLKLECQRGWKVKRKMIARAQNIRDKDERQRSLTSAQAYEPQECVKLMDLFGTRKPSQAQASLERERKLKEQQGVREKNEAADAASSASLKEASIHGFT